MFEEKRGYRRRSLDSQVHIKLIKASNQSIGTNVRFEGSIWDFSVNGMRVHGKHPIEKDTTLHLQIEFEFDKAKFALSGIVKWVTKTTENEYIAGLELDEAHSQDLDQWRERFD